MQILITYNEVDDVWMGAVYSNENHGPSLRGTFEGDLNEVCGWAKRLVKSLNNART